MVLGSQGSVLKQGSYSELSSELENLNNLVHINQSSDEESPGQPIGKSQACASTQHTIALDTARRTGDIST